MTTDTVFFSSILLSVEFSKDAHKYKIDSWTDLMFSSWAAKYFFIIQNLCQIACSGEEKIFARKVDDSEIR